MNKLKKYLVAGFFMVVISVSADYLEGAKRWAKKWQELKSKNYTVAINFAADAGVTVGNVGIGLGQFTGRFKGKPFSSHNNLHGIGPWTKVRGTVEKNGDITKMTVNGEIAGLAINYVLTAGPDKVTYRWRGEMTDPTPELERVNFQGAFYTWRNKKIDPACVAFLKDGRKFKFRMRSDFTELIDVKRYKFVVEGKTVTIDFSGTKNLRVRRDKHHPAIPVRYFFIASGPPSMTPGAVFEYKIEVSIKPE